eukprot:scaffold9069_cov134-Skeletonema_marinoi.AAC.4
MPRRHAGATKCFAPPKITYHAVGVLDTKDNFMLDVGSSGDVVAFRRWCYQRLALGDRVSSERCWGECKSEVNLD